MTSAAPNDGQGTLSWLGDKKANEDWAKIPNDRLKEAE